MPHAINVANWFIQRVNNDTEGGDNITNLKVQKLMYYAQGFSLAILDAPLFPEEITAWPHGPVVPRVYEEFKSYGAQPLPTDPDFTVDIFSSVQQELLEDVFAVYGQYSAWGLRNLTHSESPWKDAGYLQEITQDSMKCWFLDNLVTNE